MSAGVYNVARSIWDDPDFADEPFTEREAWLWLVGAAAFKETRVRGQHGGVTIKRGEFCFSIRFLGERWQWSKSRVARFLKMLHARDNVRDTSRDSEKIYSIKNYSRFQEYNGKHGTPNGTTDEEKVGRKWDNERDKEELSNSVTQKEDTPSSEGVCAEPQAARAPPEPKPPPIITLPTNKAGEEVPIFQEQIDEHAKLYPNVDVEQQFRAMRGWLLSNPTKRKTAKGMARFINLWLSKEQDGGGRSRQEPGQAHRRHSGGGGSATFFDECVESVRDDIADERERRANQSAPRGTVAVLPPPRYDAGTGKGETEPVRVGSARRF